jgi:uncharacterized membrane protein YeaQ/YmgE (transglycosylase-associated protein family)
MQGSLIIGGIAGWLAEQFMKSDMGLLMNIVLGIVGAAVASSILSVFGIVFGGMDRLSHCWLHWRVLADLGRPRDTGTPDSLRAAMADQRETLSLLGCVEVHASRSMAAD